MESHFCLVHHKRAAVVHLSSFPQHTRIWIPTGRQYHNTHLNYYFYKRSLVTGSLTEQLPEILAKVRMHLLRDPYISTVQMSRLLQPHFGHLCFV